MLRYPAANSTMKVDGLIKASRVPTAFLKLMWCVFALFISIFWQSFTVKTGLIMMVWNVCGLKKNYLWMILYECCTHWDSASERTRRAVWCEVMIVASNLCLVLVICLWVHPWGSPLPQRYLAEISWPRSVGMGNRLCELQGARTNGYYVIRC